MKQNTTTKQAPKKLFQNLKFWCGLILIFFNRHLFVNFTNGTIFSIQFWTNILNIFDFIFLVLGFWFVIYSLFQYLIMKKSNPQKN